ncbi:transposase [Alienimonas chondri]|uniref:transposase n=1 Tax=Alienimonas chondri TaxID=2681879 RepID=UPI0014891F2F|nr:transposase [Alienimonas chondri]
MAWLESLDPRSHRRLLIDRRLCRRRHAAEKFERVDRILLGIAREEPGGRLLITRPGIGHVAAVGLRAALDPIGRFKDGDHAAAYLGLVPTTRPSGTKAYHGRIAKVGAPQIRGLLTQSRQRVARRPILLGAFYRELPRRKPPQAAIMALARKLVTIADLMLKHDEPCRDAQPMLTDRKFTKLQRKRRPKERGKPRPAEGLTAVYDGVDLPETTGPDALPTGERRMLLDKDVMRYVEELRPADEAVRRTGPVDQI